MNTFEVVIEFLPMLCIGLGIVVMSIIKTKKAQAKKGSQHERSLKDDNLNSASKTSVVSSPPPKTGFWETLKQTISEFDEDKPFSSLLRSDDDKSLEGESLTKNDNSSLKGISSISGHKVMEPNISSSMTSNMHAHTAEKASVGGEDAHVKTEKVVVSGSLGGDITEGCVEHYGTRFVMEDMPISDSDEDVAELQKYIVLGEVLNNPRYKHKY
ncbi:MAG: hypothetical protein RR033_03190 [Clostridia bacterium]